MMRSTAAYGRLEKHFLGNEFSIGNKRGWFTEKIILIRNDEAIVSFYEKLLRSEIKDDYLRNIIIQTLFDYRPKDKEWFPYPLGDSIDEYPRSPPPYREASTEVLQKILKIAKYSEMLKINEKTRGSIAKGRKEIERILDYRRNQAPRVPQLLKELAAVNFQVRDKAGRELEQIADLAEPDLRERSQENLRSRREDALRTFWRN